MVVNRALAYVLKRLFVLTVGIMVLLTAEFLILRVLPGDPEQFAVPRTPYPPPDQLEYNSELLGKPLPEQYFEFIGDMLTGDFAYGYRLPGEVSDYIFQNAGWTLMLFLPSLIISFLFGSLAGRLVSRLRTHVARQILSFGPLAMASLSVLAYSWLLIEAFAVNVHLLPISGNMTVGATPELSAAFLWDVLTHAVLPIASISLAGVGLYALITRDGSTRRQSLVGRTYSSRTRFADALFAGLPNMHLMVGATMCFVVIVEMFFNYRGLGWLFLQSIYMMDYFVVQASFFLMAVIVFLSNFAIDIGVTLARPEWKLDSLVDAAPSVPTPAAAASPVPAAAVPKDERVHYGDAVIGIVRDYLRSPVGVLALLALAGVVAIAVVGPLIVTDELVIPYTRSPSYLFLTGATGPVAVLVVVGAVASLLGIAAAYIAGLAWRYFDVPMAAVAHGLLAMPLVPLVMLLAYADGLGRSGDYGLALRMSPLIAVPIALLACHELVMSRGRTSAESGPAGGSSLRGSSMVRSFPAVLSGTLSGLKYGLVMALTTVFLCDFTGITHWESWGAGLGFAYSRSMFMTGEWDYLVPLFAGIFLMVGSVFLVFDTLERVVRERFNKLV